MNILLIGNGFDLAHGLPTTYMDFLEFCKRANRIFSYSPEIQIQRYQHDTLDDWKANVYIKGVLRNVFLERNHIDSCSDEMIKTYYAHLDEFYKITKDNFWIKYFSNDKTHVAGNWIDFESEISKIIRPIADTMCGLETKFSLYDKVSKWSNDFLENYFSINIGITYGELRDILLLDLNKLIRAFEIYLTEFVERIDIKRRSPNIEWIMEQGIDCVLSFNYTHTFLKEYVESKNTEEGQKVSKVSFDYIHGETGKSENNMVLGIDEYLKGEDARKNVEFIAFKKYFQRIHKGTGCKYKEWLDIINEDFRNLNDDSEKQRLIQALYQQWYHLHIFGHSLDITDKDILKDLILTEGIFTTIYYRNLDQKGQQIANLVKVIGPDELIRRTGGGSARTIEFISQKEMVEK